MKLDPHICPECGEPADRIVEKVIAVAGIDVQDDGTWEYDGTGSEVDWNTQKPVRQAGERVTLQCTEGHEWQAVEIDDEPTLREKGDDVAAAATAFVTQAATADAQRLALCREVFDTFFSEFETFREQHLGAYLAYLMGAIIDPDVTGPMASFVELFEDVEDDACFLQMMRRLFGPEHPVWKHVVVEGGDPASPA